MAGFFYFLEGAASLQHYGNAGLGDRFELTPIRTPVGSKVGPDGRSGIVFHRYGGDTLPTPLGPWHKARRGNYWIGWHRPSQPGPADLRRDKIIDGWEIELRDGKRWLIPLVLPCTELDPERRSGLQRSYRLAGESIAADVAPEYRPLVERAERMLACATTGEGLPDATEQVEYIAAVLSVCYRIGADEIAALELGGPIEGTRIMQLTIDMNERVRAALTPEERDAIDAQGLTIFDLENVEAA